MGFPLLHALLHTLREVGHDSQTHRVKLSRRTQRWPLHMETQQRPTHPVPRSHGPGQQRNRSTPKLRPSNHRQPFIRAGAKPHALKTLRPTTSVLDLANDWILLVDDVPSRTIFPLCTGIDTTQRPDIIIYSKSMKIIIWGELTVPLEENISAAAIRKRNRYSVSTKWKLSLADQCRRNFWTVHDFTFEVGLLGWIGYSTRRFLSKLGFKSSHLKWLLKRISKTTMRSSYLIWCCRKERTWEPPEMIPLRVPTAVPHNADPPTSTQQKANKNKKESSR